mmetsp:Transcript_21958/g.36775  ORF Transcript_21958/g.36775 Transcript_21958/m.36775 type:complete len:225 (-) Transcript_21958:311-985(-)|eukprot:CAMPEP_0174974380 /NCGR_PEP_ID=MMETSP0004_2-20121128/11800_1 /TAXON_ID=420556 /ORGANISM="Ochromonas sp., Strain CCMP1393" /LENGTH=224 /DNA_ID=CAMNT_0016225003 /DNA_START=101 /DNA_END=775 /DNA_ORIENTATION=-
MTDFCQTGILNSRPTAGSTGTITTSSSGSSLLLHRGSRLKKERRDSPLSIHSSSDWTEMFAATDFARTKTTPTNHDSDFDMSWEMHMKTIQMQALIHGTAPEDEMECARQEESFDYPDSNTSVESSGSKPLSSVIMQHEQSSFPSSCMHPALLGLHLQQRPRDGNLLYSDAESNLTKEERNDEEQEDTFLVGETFTADAIFDGLALQPSNELQDSNDAIFDIDL